MNKEILYRANEWVLGPRVSSVMVAASEVGFRLGRRLGKQTSEHTKSQLSTVEAGIIGLLGPLLAFSISMAVDSSRSEGRLCLKERTRLAPPICVRSSYPRR
jgi:hypothetical protein